MSSWDFDRKRSPNTGYSSSIPDKDSPCGSCRFVCSDAVERWAAGVLPWAAAGDACSGRQWKETEDHLLVFNSTDRPGFSFTFLSWFCLLGCRWNMSSQEGQKSFPLQFWHLIAGLVDPQSSHFCKGFDLSSTEDRERFLGLDPL